jgi:hypothetical protein
VEHKHLKVSSYLLLPKFIALLLPLSVADVVKKFSSLVKLSNNIFKKYLWPCLIFAGKVKSLKEWSINTLR